MTFVGWAILVVLAVLVGWVVPAMTMRMLFPSLVTDGPRIRNYRGKHVALGLGLVWLPWALGVPFAETLARDLEQMALHQMEEGWRWFGGELLGPFLDGMGAFSVMPVALVMAAFAFGLVDDLFGGHGVKGFKGHLGALAMGRLTTGGLKLFGIGVASALVAWGLAARFAAPKGPIPDFPGDHLIAWLLVTFVIALTANLVNLTDLRPGRALKTYTLVIVPVLVAAAFFGVDRSMNHRGGVGIGFAWTLMLSALLLGPVLAVWRYDLTERGMLGDAGANAFGVLAGYMLAAVLPLTGLIVAFALLLALNLLSEKVSFSAVIERNPVLRWLDGLGRRAEE